MESFREPNFKQVAEILVWLVERYDPDAGIPSDVDTESDRVFFIKNVAQFMAQSAGVRLNTKKLYRADGNAVKEMLKLTSVLYKSMQTDADKEHDEEMGAITVASFDLSSRAKELRDVRALASEITERGAQLYDLLGNEVELREERSAAIARPLEIDAIEAGLKKSIASVNEQYAHYLGLIDNLSLDEANLTTKITKKTEELDRNQRRLKSLQSVRPAFMDEYERVEKELAVKYEVYVEKFRNLTYLEHQLEEVHRAEQDKFEETEESLKRMQERLRAEEKRRDDGGSLTDDESSLDSSELGLDDDDELGDGPALDLGMMGDEDFGARPTGAGGGATGNLAGGDLSDSGSLGQSSLGDDTDDSEDDLGLDDDGLSSDDGGSLGSASDDF